MRTLFHILLLSFGVLMGGVACAWQEKLSYDVDLEFSQQAPWKVGQVVFMWADYRPGEPVCGSCRHDRDLNDMSNMKRVFLGVTPQGNYLVQEFYKTDESKLSDPYLVNDVKGVTAFDSEPYTLYKKVLWYPNGRKMKEGHFGSGQRQASWTYWYANGEMREQGEYLNGEKHGLWTFYREDGQKKSEAQLVNGRNEGLYVWWHANGQKAGEQRQKAGKRDGLWVEWDDNGVKIKEVLYKDDTEVSVYLKNGEDEQLYWRHPNGYKAKEEHYKAGQKNGLWVEWDDNGVKVKETMYEEGVPVGSAGN